MTQLGFIRRFHKTESPTGRFNAIQEELFFRESAHCDLHEWLVDRRKTGHRRIAENLRSSLWCLLRSGSQALIAIAKHIPAPVWTVGSMLLSIAFYSSRFGWELSTGFMLLLLIHECGHLLAARYQGARTSVPIFIPYIGAIIDMQKPRNAWEGAVIGISGPIIGSLGAFTCLAFHRLTGSFYFAELALLGFFLNLFNLIPLGFLDGGHIAATLSRWLWIPGYLLMGAFAWYTHAPVPILALIVMLPMVISLFRAKSAKRHSPDYDRVSLKRRITMGILYVALISILAASICWVWCNDIAPGLHSGKRLLPTGPKSNITTAVKEF